MSDIWDRSEGFATLFYYTHRWQISVKHTRPFLTFIPIMPKKELPGDVVEQNIRGEHFL
jgi:hypothetical protein